MMEAARKHAAKLGLADVLITLYKPEFAFLKQGHVRGLWEDLLSHDKDQISEFTAWRNRMTIRLVPPNANRVLEVGIGSGHALEHLARRAQKLDLYGTDISQHAVENAKARFEGQFAVAGLGELPWPGMTFDVILMLEVLEHVEVTRTLDVLKWLHAILNNSGSLILSVPLETVAVLRGSSFLCPHCDEFVNPNGHVRSYSDLQPISLELATAGFQVERTYGLAGGRYFGIPRQFLMSFFPDRIQPMVMVFCCSKRAP